MKPINIDRLNMHSPYSVWEKNVNAYRFITDFGVIYRIEFIPDETIWEEGAYEFAIFNENSKASPNDSKVRQTIFAIVEEFFINNPDILIYQCETGDNKQSARARLFLRWFKE